MNILMFGKYPPIQGGVSAQTYWLARRLAQSGHHVTVVTNAREVETNFKMFMRPEDWARAEASPEPGSLRVSWTDPGDASERHIPRHKPFFTKLVSLGLEAAATQSFDVVFSSYLEPYAVAGHTVARELGLPHIVKTAGSDIGRLWRQPQLAAVYDRVFQNAAVVWTSPAVLSELVDRCRIDRDKIFVGGPFTVPSEIFRSDAAPLDIDRLQDDLRGDPGWAHFKVGRQRADLSYFGIYGKLHETKGV
ncbi:MAG: glycosyltransferase, partial [Alphaproteobacteria bacterium]|nr:glycosyltransferase [Alphaproteobacteria bacterium]